MPPKTLVEELDLRRIVTEVGLVSKAAARGRFVHCRNARPQGVPVGAGEPRKHAWRSSQGFSPRKVLRVALIG